MSACSDLQRAARLLAASDALPPVEAARARLLADRLLRRCITAVAPRRPRSLLQSLLLPSRYLRRLLA